MNLAPIDLVSAHRWERVTFTTYALSLSFFEAAKLFFQHAILFAKIINGELLLLVHPSRHGDLHKPEWVEHFLRLQNPLSRA